MFKPYWEEKVWGRVQHIFADKHAAVSLLEVHAGYRCSRHRHRERANLFAVEVGEVVIEEWDGLEGGKTMKLMRPGDVRSVRSNVWHRFRVRKPGRLTEVYWPDVAGGEVSILDIERMDEGGWDDLDELERELVERGITSGEPPGTPQDRP